MMVRRFSFGLGPDAQKRFSLPTVLVIRGLLTGGIPAGQSLIGAAELRSGTSDFGRYVTAMQRG